MFETALQDLRNALRGLARNPVFALTAILAAALGVGATTAVFSVVDRILFRSLPYANEDRLVSAGMLAPLDTNEFMFASEYFDLRHNPGPFEAVTSFQAGAIACDLTEQNPLRLGCLRVEANFLATLGLSPIIGRSFSPEEDRPNGPRVALISYGLWRSRFAADTQVIGRTIPIDGATATIVGVLPGNFEMPTLTRADILLPEALNEATERTGRALRVFGRMKPGISVTQATAQLGPHFQRALDTVPPQFRKEVSLRVRPVRDRQVGDVRLASTVLFAAVLAVLLIACANIANLLLARAVARDREMAMRAALGASRLRLIGQALTESLLLSLLGGMGGCALGYALLRAFVAIAPGGLPRLEDASIDMRVMLFALLASLGSGLLFGLAPAIRRPGAAVLGGWRTAGPARAGMRSVLVTVQIAITMVLLSGAGLLLRSLWKLESVPLGIQTDRVLAAHFVLGKQRYNSDADQLAFFRQLEQTISNLPGVEASALSDSVPPSGGYRGRPLAAIAIEGRPRRPEGTGGMIAWRYITPGYFAALGIPIVRGRRFDDRDRAQNSHSVILGESLAHRLFPDEDPIGKQILKDNPQGSWFTVVGVVRDVKGQGPVKSSDPEYYLVRKAVPDVTFHNQEPPMGWRGAFVVVRTSISPKPMIQSIRSAIASLDPTLPVEMETMQQRLEESTAGPRFNAVLLSVFAGMGVLLAAVGLFGVMSFLVAQRTREIGVRLALGATPAGILRFTLQYAARWTIAGLAAGAVSSIAVSRLLRSLLFQVEPVDPVVVAGSVILLCSVALVAAAGPARRAARVDPMVALREE